jgi:hypothetical protein
MINTAQTRQRQADLAVKQHFKYRRDLEAAFIRLKRAIAKEIHQALKAVGL